MQQTQDFQQEMGVHGAQTPVPPRQDEVSAGPQCEPTVVSPAEKLNWGLDLGT